jgi:hypothetical protein
MCFDLASRIVAIDEPLQLPIFAIARANSASSSTGQAWLSCTPQDSVASTIAASSAVSQLSSGAQAAGMHEMHAWDHKANYDSYFSSVVDRASWPMANSDRIRTVSPSLPDNEIDMKAVKDLNNDFLKDLVPVLKHRMIILKLRDALFA